MERSIPDKEILCPNQSFESTCRWQTSQVRWEQMAHSRSDPGWVSGTVLPLGESWKLVHILCARGHCQPLQLRKICFHHSPLLPSPVSFFMTRVFQRMGPLAPLCVWPHRLSTAHQSLHPLAVTPLTHPCPFWKWFHQLDNLNLNSSSRNPVTIPEGWVRESVSTSHLTATFTYF